MAKLYFDGSDISQDQALQERLVVLVERGAERLEKQGSFRSFYDIEITGIAVYYRKNWRYDSFSHEGNGIEKMG